MAGLPYTPRIWLAVSLLIVVVLILDISLPPVAVGTLLCAPVALAALVNAQVVWPLTALCVLVNIFAEIVNLEYSHSGHLANRLVSIVTLILVALLSVRSRQALEQAAQLREEEKLARQAEILRDLIYAFSHDLRTPLLAHTMTMTAALRGAYGPLNAEYQQTLHNGLEANRTLLALADQLLLVAKLEGAEPPDEREHFELSRLVGSVWQALEPQAQAKGLLCTLQLRPLELQGQPHDVRRAVQNLLDNAIKFSPQGGCIGVTLNAEGQWATLQVTDTGEGVPESRRQALFQRFSGGGAGKGKGLGLYLTRRIAEAHGGSVAYERQNDQSVFTLRLPIGQTL